MTFAVRPELSGTFAQEPSETPIVPEGTQEVIEVTPTDIPPTATAIPTEIPPTFPPPPTEIPVVRVETESMGITGVWTPAIDPQASLETYYYSSGGAGEVLTLYFEGTEVTVFYVTGPFFGEFTVEVDGVVLQTVQSESTDVAFLQLTVTDLLPGSHILYLRPVEGDVAAIDAVEVEALALITPTPTPVPTDVPTEIPTEAPPTDVPTEVPTDVPPTDVPTEVPTDVPTEVALQTLELVESAVVLNGTWTQYASELATAGHYWYTSGSPEDTLTLRFEGDRAEVTYVQHPDLGSFSIEIDGTVVQFVTTTSDSSIFGAVAVVEGLIPGEHTLRIVPAGGMIAIDAVAVATPLDPIIEEPTEVPTEIPTEVPTETPTAEPTAEPTETPTEEPPFAYTLEVDDPMVAADGLWTMYESTAATNGRYFYSSGATSDGLTVNFTGTRAAVTYVQHEALGTFNVELDGAVLQTVDSTTAGDFSQTVTFENLTDADHVLRIVPVEGMIAIDTLSIDGQLIPPPVDEPVRQTVESDDALVVSNGTWTAYDDASASGGRYIASSGSAEDTLSLTFEGTFLEVVYVTHSTLGSFDVEVDGAVLASVNATGESQWNQTVTLDSLSEGTHTVRIVPTAGAVVIDAFVVDKALETTREPLPVEPDLTILYFTDFDDRATNRWNLGDGWVVVPNENGWAFSTGANTTPAVYTLETLSDYGAAARFLFQQGAVNLNLRQSETGMYTAQLAADGTVNLLRSGEVVASEKVAATQAGEWRTLQLTAIGDTLWVSVDLTPVLAYRDENPLPAGLVSFGAATADVTDLVVDDFVLLVSPNTLQTAGIPENKDDDKQATLAPTAPMITDIFAVVLASGSDPNAVAARLGFVNLGQVGNLADTYAFQYPGADVDDATARTANRLLANDGAVIWFEQQDVSPLVKDVVITDPLYAQQWHLKSSIYQGANVDAAWNLGVDGTGVQVAVVDDSLQHIHPDLNPNYNPAGSYDFLNNDADPSPVATADNHGTSVGGVIAADNDGAKCGVGAAYNATLAGIRFLGTGTTDTVTGNALSYQQQLNQIYNNSWGYNTGAYLSPTDPLTMGAISNGVSTGRGGLGNIFVFAAGNERQYAPTNPGFNGNTNASVLISSPYVIVVSATDVTGRLSYYSNYGASVFVTAPSNGSTGMPGITTTDRMGSFGYNGLPDQDCTNAFGGTSSATPLVSGIIALMLDANPNLTWRDVQHILAISSMKNDPGDPDWRTNTGGYKFNHKYGFGRVDAAAAVALAKIWQLMPARSTFNSYPTIAVNQTIPDNNVVGINSSYTVSGLPAGFVLEHVEVVFNATHTYRGDVNVSLTAPSGTVSRLMETRPYDNGDDYVNRTFMSVHFWGETGNGQWRINVSDRFAGDIGTFQNWRLILHGYVKPAVPTATPTLVSPTNYGGTNDSTPVLTWNAVPNAANYHVQVATDPLFANIVYENGFATGTSDTVTTPLPDRAYYYWRVRGRALNFFTPWSVYYAFLVDTSPPPGTPMQILPAPNSGTSDNTPMFMWSYLPTATQHQFVVDDTNTCASPVYTSPVVASTVFTLPDANKLGEGRYYWCVRSADAYNNWTPYSPATFFDVTLLMSPVNFSVVQAPSMFLTWAAAPGTGVTYTLIVDDTNTLTSPIINQSGITTTNYYIAPGVLPADAYFWRVVVNGGTWTVSQPIIWGFVYTPTPFAAPVQISPPNYSSTKDTTPTFTWNPVAPTPAMGINYQIMVDDSSLFNSLEIVDWSSGATSYTPTTPLPDTPGKLYYWKVRAIYDGVAYGPWSATWAFTLDTVDPAAATLSSPLNGSISYTNKPFLFWIPPVGGAKYDVYLDTNPTPATKVATVNTSMYFVPNPLPPATYYWRIVSYDAAGNDGPSSTTFSFVVPYTTWPRPPVTLLTPPNYSYTNDTTPTFTWSAVPPIPGISIDYEIQVDDSPIFNSINFTTTTSTLTATVSPALPDTPGTLYYWRVRARYNGSPEFWTTWAFTLDTVAPGAATLSSPLNGSISYTNKPFLFWIPPVGGAQYDVYLDTNPTPATKVATVNTSMYFVPNPLPPATYYWRIVSYDAAGNDGPSSATFSFVVPYTTWPRPPVTLLTPPNYSYTNDTTPTFTWSAVPPIPGISIDYEIQVDDSPIFNSINFTTTTSLLTTTVSPALPDTPGTLYYWRVRARYNGNPESWTTWAFTLDTVAPGAATPFSPPNGSTVAVRQPFLFWMPPVGGVKYDVYLDTNPTPATKVATVNTTMYYVPAPLVPDTYYWRIVSYDAAGTAGPSSATFSFVVPFTTWPRTFITLLTPPNYSYTNDTTPTFTWNPGTPIPNTTLDYEIQVDDSPSFNSINFTTTTPTLTATVSPALPNTPGTLYYWRVRARYNGVGDTWSGVWAFTLDNTPPAAATPFSPPNSSTVAVRQPFLFWSPPVGGVKYDVYLDTNLTPSTLVAANVNTTLYYVPAPLVPDTYYWRIVSYDAAGNQGPTSSTFSFIVPFTTWPRAFITLLTPPNGSLTSDTTPTFTWNPGTPIPNTTLDYQIQVDDSPAFTTPEIDTTTSATTYTPSTPLPDANGKLYYWRVRARYNGVGDTWSGVWFFTLDNTAPGAATLTVPANGSSVFSNRPFLMWTMPVGGVKCDVYLDTNSNPPTLVATVNTSLYYPPAPLEPNTYYWRVVCYDAANNQGPSSLTFSFTVPYTTWPRAFITLVAPPNGSLTNDTTPTFTWNPGTPIPNTTLDYEIQVDDSPAFTTPEISATTAATTYTHGTPLPNADGKVYYWRVRARYNGVGDNWSGVWFFTLDNVVGTPTITSPVNGSNVEVQRPTLIWTYSPGAVRYEVQCGSPAPVPPIYTSYSTVFTLPYPLLYGTYQCQVRSIDTVGNVSAWSPVVSFNVVSPTATGAPIPNLAPQYNLSWTPITWATVYEIQIDNDATFVSPEHSNNAIAGGVTSISVPALPNGIYNWRIRASNGTTWGAWSTPGTFVVNN